MNTDIKIGIPFFKNQKQEELFVKIENYDTLSELKIKFAEFHEFAGVSSKVAVDFFFISSFVYGVDRFIKRKIYSTDGWSRELNIVFPVYKVELWNKTKTDLEKLLSFLTGDYWNVSFSKNSFEIPEKVISDEYKNIQYKQVNLFSGGLDSLIGAIDFLADENNKEENILLVSHSDSQMKSKKEQNALYQNFPDNYKKRAKRVSLIEVSLRSTSLKSREKTFRSRSLLFLGIAVLIADYKKLPIIVPENGSVSLNYPLNSSRRGACSTRTTHPTFINMVISLLSKLSLVNNITNPYEFKTKGDMVRECRNLELLQKIVAISNSCGKRGHTINRSNKSSSHCGVCMPCTYRKASLIKLNDTTTYGDDINKRMTGRKRQTPFLLSKQGQDINAMLDFLGQKLTTEKIRQELRINGVNNIKKLDRYIDLVIRTRNELKSLVEKTCKISERKKKAGL